MASDEFLSADSNCKNNLNGYTKESSQNELHEATLIIKDSTNISNFKMIPSGTAGIFSLTTLHWMNKLMWNAGRKGLSNLSWKLALEDTAAYNYERFHVIWEKEQQKEKGPVSFGNAVWQFQKTRQFATTFTLALTMTLIFLGPAYIFRLIFQHLEGFSLNPALWYGVILVLCLGITEFFRVSFFSMAWNIANITGIRTRGAVLSIIYRKLLKTRSFGEQSIGELVNICTADAFAIYEAAALGAFVMATPMSLIGIIVFSIYLLHEWALIGCGVFIASFPIQFLVAKVTTSARRKAYEYMDKRISLMNDILNSIKLIKMYAWEDSFIKQISEHRKSEEKYLYIANCAQSVTITVSPLVPIFAYSLTFIAYILASHDIRSDEVFSLISVFVAARFALGIFPNALRAIAENKVACIRIQELLTSSNFEPPKNEGADMNNNVAVKLSSVTFACEEMKNKQQTTTKLKRLSQKLRVSRRLSQLSFTQERSRNLCDLIYEVDMNISKGSLVGLCGSVGSGKSSLLTGLLGEMRLVKGEMILKGEITFVPQQAWIFKGTVKENILFGNNCIPDLYDKVIHSCNLIQDFHQLPKGDLTAVGERGLNLSGGQRQRISLARALYQGGDIYLLDDPLSAVDPRVGKHIFEQAILGFLKNKTVIFASHQLQFLKDCDFIYLLKEGQIKEKGTHTDLMKQNREYAFLFKKHVGQEHYAEKEKNIIEEDDELEYYNDDEDYDDHPDELIVSEEKQSGGLKLSVIFSYMKESGGVCFSLFTYLLFIIFIGLTIFNTTWLSIWLKAGSGNLSVNESENISNTEKTRITLNPHLYIYVEVFGITLLGILIAGLIKGQLFMLGAKFASRSFHNKMLMNVMHGTQTFFDTNPVGRILNRFSRDLEEVDSRLPFFTEFFTTVLLICIGSVIQVIYVVYYVAIVIVILVVIIYILDRLFRTSMNELKRCDNVTRSPVISHLTITMQGLASVRAYKKEDQFITKFEELVDENTVPFSLFNFAMRWYSWRVDMVTVTLLLLTALILVLVKIDASGAGLALSSTFQIALLFQLLMRLKSDTESKYVSLERVRQYVKNVPREQNQAVLIEPPENWPNIGSIHFENVCLQYREGLPNALDNVRFSIAPEEKIGIVGRTGSGKSTLGVSLFRLHEIKYGQIMIDDIDIRAVDLKILRSRISIIPQEPVLFSGTMRYNLDPFNQHKDEDLWNALAKVQLKERIKYEDKQLETVVESDGENFSVGQRQLICLARAILRNSKILLLDEATASIDTETDSVIQNIIKKEFKHCTILTIAHRLNTVMDCDKILVMQNGKVMEFDSPANLLSQKNSLFSRMVADAGLHLPITNQKSVDEPLVTHL